jgi:hypothetical protein
VLLLLALLVAAALYSLSSPVVRIASLEIRGAEALLPGTPPTDLAREAMLGRYFGIVPRDSILFPPKHRIRTSIISAHPEVAAVSFVRKGLNTLLITTSLRTAVGRWCGLAPTEGVTPYCYLYDPNGFIYSALPDPADALGAASSSPEGTVHATSSASIPAQETRNPFALYAPLVGDTQPARPDDPGRAGGEPLRATIERADMLPDAFAFARQLPSFGSAVESLVIRDDEADLWLVSGTRVTYVLGHEEEVFAALQSALYVRKDLNLADGSLEYMDMRFEDKVYLKKRVDSVQESVNSQ